jgi:hypothetical protein
MSESPSMSELRERLLARSVELTGHRPDQLVDADGDVQLRDSPFGVWVRIAAVGDQQQPSVVFVLAPLAKLPASDAVVEAVNRAASGHPAECRFSEDTVQIFYPAPASVLDRAEAFRDQVAQVVALGESVVAAVQPRFGGLTPEQFRVLSGWRGRDESVEEMLREVAGKVGGRVLTHGWNPSIESAPLLVVEERVPGGWANRFVTVDDQGALRFRSTVPGVREGVKGFALRIDRLDPETARVWARRLGVVGGAGPLGTEEVRSLRVRAWSELTGAFRDLPHDTGDAWQPVDDA